MQLIAQTGPRGKVIQQNATRLAQALAQGSTTMYIEKDVFSDNDVVTVGEEDILITAHGTTCTVTRAQNGTTDSAHASGANVRLASGAELLSHTFDGSTYLSAIRAGGELEAALGIEIDGTIKYIAATSPYQLELFFPMNRYQPANNTTIRVLAWIWVDEAVLWAQMQA
ncbi:MAG: hypothetical protein DRP79_07415 [Planctomycetota bacterium]|nr:MAG: hypothetical protein DRP79_07415 [Planctomycetota bacterium]